MPFVPQAHNFEIDSNMSSSDEDEVMSLRSDMSSPELGNALEDMSDTLSEGGSDDSSDSWASVGRRSPDHL